MARQKKEPEPKSCIISNGILPEPSYLIGEPVFDRKQWGSREQAALFSPTEAKALLKKVGRIYHSPRILSALTGD